jgi:hypothetical protein
MSDQVSDYMSTTKGGPGTRSKRGGHGLLAQIQADVLDESKPLAGTLRKCIALGGQAGSADLREWAARELKGYDGPDELPAYRVVYAPIKIDAVTANAIIKGQTISPNNLPDFVAKEISERLELRQAVGELEALAARYETTNGSIQLSLPMGSDIAQYMNHVNDNPWQHIQAVYWAVNPVVVRGVIDKVRTVLAELVAELRAGMADDEEIPSADLASQAMSIAVHGRKARVTVTNAQASAGSSASIDTTQPAETQGFWTKWRRIGAFIVGIATIVGGIAAVLALMH